MDAASQLPHAAPADQPHGVSEIAARLLSAYTVDDGSVHLAGCQLEDRPFLRLQFEGADGPVTRFVSMRGKPLDPGRVTELGLWQLVDLPRPPQRLGGRFEAEVQAAVEAARQFDSAIAVLPPVSTTAVWCKHVDGKVRFSVGEVSADLPFAGWARSIEPPPYPCLATGTTTFHLAATDDGRLVAADQLQRCGETGRLLPKGELVTCAATGLRVAASQTRTCPVSGDRVLARMMVRCEICRQEVAPGSVTKGVCFACRSLQKVRKADPRLARLLDEHPVLDRWRHWRIAETAEVYILSARRWLTRLMLVVDKESLHLRFMATASGPFGLRGVSPEQYEYVLRD
ncbi:MAG: hypothetical protein U1E05_24340 [Patescibacteria group bacterium]|nr:hypothetical protein [Patescibacteria group bacterium]